MRRGRRIVACLILLSLGCVNPDAKPELRLHLELAKNRWHVGEYLWYRISLENTGKASFAIYDDSWINPKKTESNFDERRWTYLEILDAKGKPAISGLPSAYYEFCARADLSHYPYLIRIRKGESVIADIRSLWPHWLLPSLRALWKEWVAERTDRTPWGSFGEVNPGQTLSQAPIALNGACQALWDDGNRRQVLGDSHLHLGEYPLRLPASEGFRVLDAYPWPLKPGRYRISAVFDARLPVPPVSAEEAIQKRKARRSDLPGSPSFDRWARAIHEDWKKATPQELNDLKKWRAEVEERNKELIHLVSSSIEFEVVP